MESSGHLATLEFDASFAVLGGRVVNTGSHPVAPFEPTGTKALQAGRLRSRFEQRAGTAWSLVETPGSVPLPVIAPGGSKSFPARTGTCVPRGRLYRAARHRSTGRSLGRALR